MKWNTYLKYAVLPTLIALVLLLRALPDITGKPLFRSPAYNAAEKYLAEHYPGMDLVIGDIVWSDHGGDYHAKIYSPTHSDLQFTLVVGSRSKVVEQDTYAEDVLGGRTVADRLSREYGALVEEALKAPGFPHDKGLGLLDLSEVPISPEETYDVRELGKTAGFLYVSVQSEAASTEEAARLLLSLKDHMDGLPFYSVTLYLWGSGDLTVQDFLCEDIYADGLEERVKEKSTLETPAGG